MTRIFFSGKFGEFSPLDTIKRGSDLSKGFFMEEKAQSCHISRTKKVEVVIFRP